MDDLADDLLNTMFIVESLTSYLAEAYRKDQRKHSGVADTVGWRSLNAVRKGVNRRMAHHGRKAKLDHIRAILQLEIHSGMIETEQMEYALRPESNTMFRVTTAYWMHKFFGDILVTN